METESEPVCISNCTLSTICITKEFDIIQMTCSVNYSGNWAPVMKWQQDGGPVITDGRVVNKTVPYKSVTYSLTVRATSKMNGSKFSCTTYFSADNKSPTTTATNVPDYIYSWDTLFDVKC